ncbi:MAG: bifunctional UDP-N-acetylglucosamine diphosphorylase/glucosamine-1-phosphate N-acetyltransferase GlmU [Pseudomonadota bacterium]
MDAKALAIVLAAGKGTRMRSKLPKVMHPVGGLPMIRHVLKASSDAGIDHRALVVDPDAGWAQNLPEAPSVFVQAEQLGTAHAVLSARTAMTDAHDVAVVLYGDNPLISGSTIAGALSRARAGADVVVLAFRSADPTGYGRVLMTGGALSAIREERDATPAERAVTLCNSGIMVVRNGPAFGAIADISNTNAKGEYYLTDLVEIGLARGLKMAVEEAPLEDVIGVNDREQLAQAEAIFQDRARRNAMAVATLEAPQTVFFSHDTELAEDVYVEPQVVFGPGVRVGEGARIRAFSHLEGAQVAAGAVVGPYARLRPGAAIGSGARVGNFVEIKNAELGEGAKVNHLAYVGDASIGARANLGAGTITCNYDGKYKYHTEVAEGAFVGSNSALVAPVSIGARAYIGSGSVVTEDVPADALAIGRGRQVNKPDRSPARRKPDDG